VHAGEGHRRTDPQVARQPGTGTACGIVGVVGLFDGALGLLEKRQARFGGRQARVERITKRTARRASSCAMLLDTAGWPMPRRLAAAENEPVSTTWTKVSMAVRRSIDGSLLGWAQREVLRPTSLRGMAGCHPLEDFNMKQNNHQSG
jgi:hypothetical protein